MGQVKGTAVIATMRFLEERFGDATLASVLQALSPAERALIEPAALASSWYPMSLLLRVMRESQAALGGHPRIMRDMGRASAEYGLTTVYRIFLKVGSPQFIIGHAARVFGSYFDRGEMRVRESRAGHATLDLLGFHEGSPELCERIRGWMERTMEMSGARNLRSAHSLCVHRGDAACRFQVDWDH